MTVRDLIDTLEEMNPDSEVYIGQYQNFGSDFAYDIKDVLSPHTVYAFYGSDDDNATVLVMGGQCGTIE